MCGICGVLNHSDINSVKPIIEKMTNSLAHRGPDEEGYYLDAQAALGMRRLSIIDVKGGHQPIHNEAKTIQVVCNGEIYNFLELKKRLEGLGHTFHTKSDIETIVHAYEEYGEDCIKGLRGMFALAIWDTRKGKLVLARDRIGKKPLLYAAANGKLIFSSEFQSLLEYPGIKREVDLGAIDEYLTYGYISAPKTAFKGINKLIPGHMLIFQDANLVVRRFWNPDFTDKLKISEEEAQERILDLLREAVKIRLVSEVPLGAFLSGGIDSSSIVALMSQLSNSPVETFSIGFEEADFSELKYSRMIARKFGTRHHEFIVKPNALEVLPNLVRHYGEPYADSSCIPTYYVSKETSRYVTVALNGDGGDELFCGYERYLAMRLAQGLEAIPNFLALAGGISRFVPDSLNRKNRFRQVKRFLKIAALPNPERYRRWVSIFSAEHKNELYSGIFKEKLSGGAKKDFIDNLFRDANNSGPVEASMRIDILSYLPYDLLVKVDIASMANSLEARSPFLDQEVVEFAMRLPWFFKLKGFTLKAILKKAMKDILPKEILRRRKMGFGVPIDYWFRGELQAILKDAILTKKFFDRGYFQAGVVRRMVEDHIDGRRDNSMQLWSLLMLELWHQQFID